MRRERSEIETLITAISWSRDKLEKLMERTRDEYVVRNLRAIAYSLDPEMNPKLKAVFERHEKEESHGT